MHMKQQVWAQGPVEGCSDTRPRTDAANDGAISSTPRPAPPPTARLFLPLGFVYIKGSGRMRCLAAAANGLGRWIATVANRNNTMQRDLPPAAVIRGLSISGLSRHVRVPASNQRLCSTLLLSFRLCAVNALLVLPYQKLPQRPSPIGILPWSPDPAGPLTCISARGKSTVSDQAIIPRSLV